MSNQPKVGDLVLKAASLGVSDEAAARELIKKNEVRSFKRLGEVVAKYLAKIAKNGGQLRVAKYRSKVVHNEGKRGFQFGPKWLASVKSGSGIAVHPSNMPKLLKTAEKFNVKVPAAGTQVEIAAAIAKAL